MARGLTWLLKLDVVLFGGIRTGPFFGLLRPPPAQPATMRILYVASDQVVPGRTGGSVHVLEVARGLAARGHEVHAVVHGAGGGAAASRATACVWHRVRWSPPPPLLPLPRAGGGGRGRATSVRPQAVMERYYNFGGEGIRAATRARRARRCWR